MRFLILAAQREGNRSLATALSPLGLTPAQAEALRVLDDHGPLSLTGLGELLVCESGTNPSRLVARLIEKGLVERRTDSHDARQILLSLTPTGTDAGAETKRVEHHLYARMAESLEGAELRPLISALEALVHGTQAGDAITRRNPNATGTEHP
ncbi:hypothetical protein GCM10027408_18510 [Microbacterium tumbae]